MALDSALYSSWRTVRDFVTDSGFDAGSTSGWSRWPSTSEITISPIEGSPLDGYCLQVSANDASLNPAGLITYVFAVEKDKSYRISFSAVSQNDTNL